MVNFANYNENKKKTTKQYLLTGVLLIPKLSGW